MSIYTKWIESQYRKLHPYEQLPTLIPPAKIYGEISVAELCEIMPKKYISPATNNEYTVRRNVMGVSGEDIERTTWDVKYRYTSTDEMKRFLEWHTQVRNKIVYHKDFWDCDDYAVQWMRSWIMWACMKDFLQGMAGGLEIIINPGHAKNFALLCDYFGRDLKLYEVEPQSSTFKPQENIITQWLM